jgi:hypothetical protein
VILILLSSVPTNTAQYSGESHGLNSLNYSETRRGNLAVATLLCTSSGAVSGSRATSQMVRLSAAAGEELSTKGLAATIRPSKAPDRMHYDMQRL